MTATELADLIRDLIAPALVPLAGAALMLARRWAINTTVLRAVARGAGAAYLTMVEQRAAPTEGAINRAVLAGAGYVEDRIPKTLDRAGVGTEALQAIIRAELGRMLAADPGVKLSGGT